jgi:hypothetical protein
VNGSAPDVPRDHVERWTLPTPAVSPELILRLQKYRDLAQVPSPIREAAATIAPAATALMEPEVVVWRGPATVVDDTAVVLDAGHRLHSRALTRLLAASREAYAIVLTIGSRLEERAHAMFEEQDFLESLLMDTAAWAAIELLARQVRRTLMDRERVHGRSVTHRIGPGHLDWSVAEQPALLGVFGAVPLPVRLNDAACMLPQKSISGVFGVVTAPRRDEEDEEGEA